MVRVLKAEKMLASKVEINIFELSRVFKENFDFEDSSRYKKSVNVIYSRNPDNHNEYDAENCRVGEII